MHTLWGCDDIVEVNKPIANATVTPFEQYGEDDKRLRAQMDAVVVDVDDYEQHIYGRYGVSYLEVLKWETNE
ncbi:hypothetical protein FEM48_Zijuj06G0209900 [Ziziphus jujuba var. spinosa]|uniref:Uncharacterized protein n=1 Tax=Ziziphus jujuba var. spinosa TaxID=714518 RepID=A0A978VBL1_ZIZJJ|nr:hypothetical protein FEM48_Zijuj06G0209900 [Ziziphus jujuba var. spinosa]